MNYFPFHLGDYAAHTGHLEPMEDLAYRRLLDQYYMREGPLPADVQTTAKLVRLRSCAADVESVLNEFFVLTEAGWVHHRCDEEIDKMQDKQSKARAAAAASVNSRKASAERALAKQVADAERALVVPQADVQLPTPTPTPTPTPIREEGTSRKRATPPARPDDVAEQVWTDWLQLRKTKNAPVTETVLTAARAEAAKAGMPLERFLSVWCARGSQGMSADWLKPDERGSAQPSGETAYQRSQRERVAEFAPSIARRAPGESSPLNIIDEALYVPSIASH